MKLGSYIYSIVFIFSSVNTLTAADRRLERLKNEVEESCGTALDVGYCSSQDHYYQQLLTTAEKGQALFERAKREYDASSTWYFSERGYIRAIARLKSTYNNLETMKNTVGRHEKTLKREITFTDDNTKKLCATSSQLCINIIDLQKKYLDRIESLSHRLTRNCSAPPSFYSSAPESRVRLLVSSHPLPSTTLTTMRIPL